MSNLWKTQQIDFRPLFFIVLQFTTLLCLLFHFYYPFLHILQIKTKNKIVYQTFNLPTLFTSILKRFVMNKNVNKKIKKI